MEQEKVLCAYKGLGANSCFFPSLSPEKTFISESAFYWYGTQKQAAS